MSSKAFNLKTTKKYHHAPIRMAKSQDTTAPNAGKDVRQQEMSFIAGAGMQMVQLLQKTV